MKRSKTIPRRLCQAAVGVALTVLGSMPAGAQIANFNTLTSPGNSARYVANCYAESNLRFTVFGEACGTSDSFATWGSADAGFYSGSPALFMNSATGTSVDITGANNQIFSLLSIDLTPFLGLSGSPASIFFTGNISGGGSVTRTIALGGATITPTKYLFNTFNSLTSVRLTVTDPSFEPYVQFDNVTTSFASSVVPEPSTVVLMAAGLLSLLAVARRRQRIS